MVHCRLGPLILAVVMMAGLGPDAVRAAAINFTGNVVQDFTTADPNLLTTEVIPVNSSADALGEWPSQTNNGTWVSGSVRHSPIENRSSPFIAPAQAADRSLCEPDRMLMQKSRP